MTIPEREQKRKYPALRLPLLPPSRLSSEQKALYDDIMSVVNKNFGSFVSMRRDGALIGLFNAMPHFPTFGRAALDFNKKMYEETTLPNSVPFSSRSCYLYRGARVCICCSSTARIRP